MDIDICHVNGKAFEVTMEYIVLNEDGLLYQSDDYDLDIEYWEPCKEISVH